MIYFQKIDLSDSSPELIDKKIREFSAKRHIPLDLQSSSTYFKDEKLFLGHENDKYIKIVRIRIPLERLLPRIIARFDKNNFKFYNIRLSWLSFLISFFLFIAIILNIVYSLIDGHWESDILSVITVSLAYLILILIEVKLTKRKIKMITR